MKNYLIRRFVCSKAYAVGEGCGPGFFAPLRMTANIVTLNAAKGLNPPVIQPPFRRVRLLAVLIGCALFIFCVIGSQHAFAQDDSGHDMQSMSQEKPDAAKSQEAQPKAQQEEAVQEVPEVEITPEQQKLIGAKIVKVSRGPLTRVIRTVGRIETNEKNVATVNTKIEGWIEKIYVDYTGAFVKKGEPLAEIYSPELLATQMEFINTLKWAGRQAGEVQSPNAVNEVHNDSSSSVKPESEWSKMLAEDGTATLDAARQRLRLWDMSEAQIAQIEETKKPVRTITIYSPISGYITLKMAVLGTRVMPGEKLFDVADFSSLWVIADIYENELPFVKLGQEAKITLSYLPDRELSSKVDFIYPTVSEDTRVARIRFSVPNPGGQLKPQMFTNVVISVDLGNRLIIPESAVIDTGMEQVVYVDLGDGNFEPREVKLGLRTAGSAEVLKGLKEGEGVSSSANFLIDSEAQLNGVKPLSGK